MWLFWREWLFLVSRLNIVGILGSPGLFAYCFINRTDLVCTSKEELHTPSTSEATAVFAVSC